MLIIDDVITAGTAINEAAEIIAQTQGQLAGVVIAFDRQERGQPRETESSLSAVEQVERELNVSVISVASASELISYAESNNVYTEHLAKLKDYMEKY